MKKIFYLIILGLKSFLRLLFTLIEGGEVCLLCGKKSYLYPLCSDCLKKYYLNFDKAFFDNRCSICGKELLVTKNTCSSCREHPLIKSLDHMLPLYPYRLWNKELMFMWKSLEVRSLSIMFAKLLNNVLKKLGAEFIVPVPPRKGKIQEKGWDQIDELCNLLKYKYGYKVLRLLERKTSIQQKKLDREGRLQQIGKAYFCVSEAKFQKQLKPYGAKLPKSVILLDDVCTTGSTLESCALILKEKGVENITGITLFVV